MKNQEESKSKELLNLRHNLLPTDEEIEAMSIAELDEELLAAGINPQNSKDEESPWWTKILTIIPTIKKKILEGLNELAVNTIWAIKIGAQKMIASPEAITTSVAMITGSMAIPIAFFFLLNSVKEVETATAVQPKFRVVKKKIDQLKQPLALQERPGAENEDGQRKHPISLVFESNKLPKGIWEIETVKKLLNKSFPLTTGLIETPVIILESKSESQKIVFGDDSEFEDAYILGTKLYQCYPPNIKGVPPSGVNDENNPPGDYVWAISNKVNHIPQGWSPKLGFLNFLHAEKFSANWAIAIWTKNKRWNIISEGDYTKKIEDDWLQDVDCASLASDQKLQKATFKIQSIDLFGYAGEEDVQIAFGFKSNENSSTGLGWYMSNVFIFDSATTFLSHSVEINQHVATESNQPFSKTKNTSEDDTHEEKNQKKNQEEGQKIAINDKRTLDAGDQEIPSQSLIVELGEEDLKFPSEPLLVEKNLKTQPNSDWVYRQSKEENSDPLPPFSVASDKVWATNGGRHYSNDLASSLESINKITIPLSGKSAELKFSSWSDIRSGDKGRVEIRIIEDKEKKVEDQRQAEKQGSIKITDDEEQEEIIEIIDQVEKGKIVQSQNRKDEQKIVEIGDHDYNGLITRIDSLEPKIDEVTNYNEQGWKAVSPIFQGENRFWELHSLNLDDFVGKTVQIAFRFESNEDGDVDKGWYIDGIQIVTDENNAVAEDDSITITEGGSINLHDSGASTKKPNDPNGTIIKAVLKTDSGLHPDSTAIPEKRIVSFLDSGASSIIANDENANALKAVLKTGHGPLYAKPGSFILNPDGTFEYEHDGSEHHLDSFTYGIVNELGAIDEATVTIHITPENDIPEGREDTFYVPQGGTIDHHTTAYLNVLENDNDEDGEELYATLVKNVDHGTLSFNNDGTFSYTHDGSIHLLDGFQYRISDGSGEKKVVDVTINVIPLHNLIINVEGQYANIIETNYQHILLSGSWSFDTDEVELTNKLAIHPEVYVNGGGVIPLKDLGSRDGNKFAVQVELDPGMNKIVLRAAAGNVEDEKVFYVQRQDEQDLVYEGQSLTFIGLESGLVAMDPMTYNSVGYIPNWSVEQLLPFPNGHQMAVVHDGSIDIIDIRTGEIVKDNLPGFHSRLLTRSYKEPADYYYVQEGNMWGYDHNDGDVFKMGHSFPNSRRVLDVTVTPQGHWWGTFLKGAERFSISSSLFPDGNMWGCDSPFNFGGGIPSIVSSPSGDRLYFNRSDRGKGILHGIFPREGICLAEEISVDLHDFAEEIEFSQGMVFTSSLGNRWRRDGKIQAFDDDDGVLVPRWHLSQHNSKHISVSDVGQCVFFGTTNKEVGIIPIKSSGLIKSDHIIKKFVGGNVTDIATVFDTSDYEPASTSGLAHDLDALNHIADDTESEVTKKTESEDKILLSVEIQNSELVRTPFEHFLLTGAWVIEGTDPNLVPDSEVTMTMKIGMDDEWDSIEKISSDETNFAVWIPLDQGVNDIRIRVSVGDEVVEAGLRVERLDPLDLVFGDQSLTLAALDHGLAVINPETQYIVGYVPNMNVDRLLTFPDGEKVAIVHDSTMDVLDVRTGQLVLGKDLPGADKLLTRSHVKGYDYFYRDGKTIYGYNIEADEASHIHEVTSNSQKVIDFAVTPEFDSWTTYRKKMYDFSIENNSASYQDASYRCAWDRRYGGGLPAVVSSPNGAWIFFNRADSGKGYLEAIFREGLECGPLIEISDALDDFPRRIAVSQVADDRIPLRVATSSGGNPWRKDGKIRMFEYDTNQDQWLPRWHYHQNESDAIAFTGDGEFLTFALPSKEIGFISTDSVGLVEPKEVKKIYLGSVIKDIDHAF